jgi:hypothetical protein
VGTIPVGARLAREGGLVADLSFAGAHRSIVGASLLAMAAFESIYFWMVYISVSAVTAA